jgi:hypothetical protein
VERVKVVSKGEGSGEGVDAILVSDTLRYFSLADLARGWGLLRLPIDLCASVSEERRDGEGAGLQELFRLSYTRRYISFADFARGVCCDNQWTCAFVRKWSQEMLHTATQMSIAAKVSASL